MITRSEALAQAEWKSRYKKLLYQPSNIQESLRQLNNFGSFPRLNSPNQAEIILNLPRTKSGALQNGFKKRCNGAAKWVAAALPNFGCLNAVTGSRLPAIKSALAAARKR